MGERFAFPERYTCWVLVWNGAYCTGSREWSIDPFHAHTFVSRARALEHAATYDDMVRNAVRIRKRVLTVPGQPSRPEGEVPK